MSDLMVSNGVLCEDNIREQGLFAVYVPTKDDAFDDFTQGVSLGQMFPEAEMWISEISLDDEDSPMTVFILNRKGLTDEQLEKLLARALASRGDIENAKEVAKEAIRYINFNRE